MTGPSEDHVRVPLVSRESAGPPGEALFDMLESERGIPTGYVFRILANCPDILTAFIPMGNAVREASGLDPVLRELGIIAGMRELGADYEFAAHSQIALKVGVTPEQIIAIDDPDSELFTPLQRAVIAFAVEVTAAARVSDATWQPVHEALGDELTVALLFNIGWYNLVARMTGPVGLTQDPGLEQIGESMGRILARTADTGQGSDGADHDEHKN